MYLSHTHTLTKAYSSEIYLYGKICDFLIFTVVTYNKAGFFDVCIYIIYIYIYIYIYKYINVSLLSYFLTFEDKKAN